MSEEPTLSIVFRYDHASGNFHATLENGASFIVERNQVTGRLQNALTLFARGVVNSSSGKWRKAPRKPDFEYSYDESDVARFSETGRQELPPLDLDINEI